jgi:hypothetical protein
MGDYDIFISTLSDLTSRLSGSNAYRYWTLKRKGRSSACTQIAQQIGKLIDEHM